MLNTVFIGHVEDADNIFVLVSLSACLSFYLLNVIIVSQNPIYILSYNSHKHPGEYPKMSIGSQ